MEEARDRDVSREGLDVDDSCVEDYEALFNDYWKYKCILRNWLVGYAAALMVLVGTKQAYTELGASSRAWMVILCAAAIGSQVVVVLGTKYATYLRYIGRKRECEGELREGGKVENWFVKVSERYRKSIKPDLGADFLSGTCLMAATVILAMGLL